MPRILLIKTTSLGDVVHNLPVVSDIAARLPEARIEWVVEQAFAAIPRMHPAVAAVIPVATRRWRRSPFNAVTRREWREYRRCVGGSPYDAVIDTQGLLKSALLARAACGTRHGLDWRSSREPLRLFYDRTYRVPWGQPAVARNRALAALALGYGGLGAVDYGIRATTCELPWLDATAAAPALPSATDHAVLLHATSADAKLWPETAWLELARHLAGRGLRLVLPWGSAAERARSERLAAAMPAAIVPPALSLDALASLLARARCVVGVDTGLTHLAAALGTPTIGVYGATDPAATGIYGCARGINLGTPGAPPTAAQVIVALQPWLAPA